MERVYKNINEAKDNLKYVPVFDKSGVHLDVYLDNKKVGRIDRHNKEIRVKVKVADIPAYKGDKPFSVSAAFYHYFRGSGKAVTVDFNEVDIGLKPSDFNARDGNYLDLVKSMYRKNGTLAVDVKIAKDIGGWAGNVTYGLKGTIKSVAHKWKFDGYIGVYKDKDTFDFDEKKWGVRQKWAEVVTRMIGTLPAGKPHDIMFKGNRTVTDRGTW